MFVLWIADEPINAMDGDRQVKHHAGSSLFSGTKALIVIEFSKGHIALHFFSEAQFGLRSVHVGGEVAGMRFQRDAASLTLLARSLHSKIQGFSHAVLAEVDEVMQGHIRL